MALESLPLRIVADIDFSVRDTGRGSDEPVLGHVRADGSVVSVEFSATPSLLGLRRGQLSGDVAELLHREGVTLRVSGPSGLVVSVGREAKGPLWQRVVTGSRYARLGSARAVAGSIRGPRVLEVALPQPTKQPRRANPGRTAIVAARRLSRRLGALRK